MLLWYLWTHSSGKYFLQGRGADVVIYLLQYNKKAVSPCKRLTALCSGVREVIRTPDLPLRSMAYHLVRLPTT